jgi:hypothetical protein
MRKALILTTALCGLLYGVSAAAQERLGPTPRGQQSAPVGGGIVLDPGFESGSPNAAWTEASSNFGTPLCTTDFCGAGGSLMPANSGDWWAWFGGIAATEVGSVEQVVTIPENSAATLSFFFQAPVCSGAAEDFIEARMNGTVLWRADATSAFCGGNEAYTQISVDATAFSGFSPTLSFFSSMSSGAVTNFFIDDVQITAAPIPVSVNTLSPLNLALLVLLLGGLGAVTVRRLA